MLNQEVKQVLLEYGIGFDISGPIINEHRMYEDIDAKINKEMIFELYSSEARYARFSDLEGILLKHNIPFDSNSGGTDSVDSIGEISHIFRPAFGDNEPLDMWSDFKVEVSKVRELLPQGVDAVKDYLDIKFPLYKSLHDIVNKKDIT